MSKERLERIAELKWKRELKERTDDFLAKATQVINVDDLEIMDFEESLELMETSYGWPGYISDPYIQIPKDEIGLVTRIIEKLNSLVKADEILVYFSGANIGLIRLSKSIPHHHWEGLMNIGGDISIFHPHDPYFISIELTSLPTAAHRPDKVWIYEVKFSKEDIRKQLTETR